MESAVYKYLSWRPSLRGVLFMRRMPAVRGNDKTTIFAMPINALREAIERTHSTVQLSLFHLCLEMQTLRFY